MLKDLDVVITGLHLPCLAPWWAVLADPGNPPSPLCPARGAGGSYWELWALQELRVAREGKAMDPAAGSAKLDPIFDQSNFRRMTIPPPPPVPPFPLVLRHLSAVPVCAALAARASS